VVGFVVEGLMNWEIVVRFFLSLKMIEMYIRYMF